MLFIKIVYYLMAINNLNHLFPFNVVCFHVYLSTTCVPEEARRGR